MNPTMVGEILLASEHMPDGSALQVPHVPWEEYELLLEELGDQTHLRVNYDSGRLEIVSTSPEHEEYGDFFSAMVRVYADVFDVDLETRGQATWKRPSLKKGAEADSCFYVRTATRIIGKRKIDLESDPPPDVVVEIEITTSSRRKFPIYAALGVPEIWTYNGRNLEFHELSRNEYVPIPQSGFFPQLTGEMLIEAMATCKTEGQTTALKGLRRKIKALKK